MAEFIAKINEEELTSCFMAKMRKTPATAGEWYAVPTYSNTLRTTMIPFRRSESFLIALRHNFDWHFNNNDKGAVSLVLGGSAAEKENFIISLGSELSDSQGYYIVFAKDALRVYRSMTLSEKIGAGLSPIGYKELQKGVRTYNPSLLIRGGDVAVTFTYHNGKFRLISGLNPNDKSSPVIASFDDARPVPGNRIFGLGMYGDSSSTDEVKLKYIQKWDGK